MAGIRKGETRELKSNRRRVNININDALRWPDRTVVHRKADKITSAEMIALFKQLQALHPQATAICAVLDKLPNLRTLQSRSGRLFRQYRQLPRRNSHPDSITSADTNPRLPERTGIS
jgi:hypothetical protein